MRGLIFDLDGVLTDTAEFHYLSWKHLADQLGVPFTRQDNHALRGVPRRISLGRLLKGETRPDDEMQALMDIKNDYYLQLIEQTSSKDLLPCVGEFLNSAKSLGFKIGLGSASQNARLVCQKLGIFELLDVIGDAFSVPNPKPAPDLFVWVAGGLGLSPAECVVFEDAESGIDAGLAGGFYTVGIGEAGRLHKAHRVVEGFHQLTVNEFLVL
jgi:beta-phosphoglucomutase